MEHQQIKEILSKQKAFFIKNGQKYKIKIEKFND